MISKRDVQKLCRVLASVVLLTVSAVHVSAQCGSGYPEVAMMIDQLEVVFGGTVLDLEIRETVRIATFEVDRVWTGNVTKRTVIYQAETVPLSTAGSRMTTFVKGRRYAVLAHTITEAERTQFALVPVLGSFAVGYCGDASRDYDLFVKYDLPRMGPGLAPQ